MHTESSFRKKKRMLCDFWGEGDLHFQVKEEEKVLLFFVLLLLLFLKEARNNLWWLAYTKFGLSVSLSR